MTDAADRRQAKGKLLVQSYVAKPPMPSRLTVVSNKRPNLGPLEATFNNEGREVANEDVACCIYANGLEFNLVHSTYCQQMIKAINEVPKGYKSPSYEKVCTPLLTLERKYVDRQLQSIRDTWTKTWVSIVSDERRDQRNQYFNVIVILLQRDNVFEGY